MIEYHCSKDPAVATRIFELGLKVFGDRLEFVDRYLAFLIMINDDQSASLRQALKQSTRRRADTWILPLCVFQTPASSSNGA